MTKTYILQKNLPDAKVGDEYVRPNNHSGAGYYNVNNKQSTFSEDIVESNPLWFSPKEVQVSEITHKHGSKYQYFFTTSDGISKDKFEAIKNFIEFVCNGNPSGGLFDDLREFVEQNKNCLALKQVDTTEVLEIKCVRVDDQVGFDYLFKINKEITAKKLFAVKNAIVVIVSNKVNTDYNLLNKAKGFYAKDDMRKCFTESRLTNEVVGFKHDSFEDYLKTIQ